MSIEEPLREVDQIDNISLPEQTQTLVGHEREFHALLAQVRAKKIPNALLIHGPRGIGKATFAFCLTKKILQLTGKEQASAINEQVSFGSHPNLYILRKKPQENSKKFSAFIRINDVREMIFSLRQTAGVNAHKVVIIDAIDDCNKSASNGLLKILEEPPKNTLFILISHRPDTLLPTIRSRCQLVPLRTLNENELLQIINNSGLKISEHNLQSSLELSQGIARFALELSSLGALDILTELQNWLKSPNVRQRTSHLALIDKILTHGEAQELFAKTILFEWIVNEAKQCAINSNPDNYRLGLISNLWQQSQKMFEQAKLYNLDKRQTLISLFDAILGYFEKLEINQVQ